MDWTHPFGYLLFCIVVIELVLRDVHLDLWNLCACMRCEDVGHFPSLLIVFHSAHNNIFCPMKHLDRRLRSVTARSYYFNCNLANGPDRCKKDELNRTILVPPVRTYAICQRKIEVFAWWMKVTLCISRLFWHDKWIKNQIEVIGHST